MKRTRMAALTVAIALSVAPAAVAEPGDYTPKHKAADVATYSKSPQFVRFRRTGTDWKWAAPAAGRTTDLRIESAYAGGGDAWFLLSKTAGKPNDGIQITDPGFQDYKSVDEIFVRKDLKELVVIGTQGSARILYRIKYRLTTRDNMGDIERIYERAN